MYDGCLHLLTIVYGIACATVEGAGVRLVTLNSLLVLQRAEARRAARRRQQAAEAAGSSEEPMEVEKPPEEEMDVTDPTAAPTSELDDDGEYQPLP